MNYKKPSKRNFKTTYTKKKSYSKKKTSGWILRILIYIISFFVIFGFITWLILYTKYIKDLPQVSELENLEIAESSIIYDRDGEELYKIFKEKRTYVEFEEIWDNMVNAIVAWEDQRYWENPWVDIVWIIRAGIYYAIGKTDWVKWTSTLTQQLIRNTIITNERSVERKVKEIYLAYKLTAWVSKEKILELYLNKISFWHNAFGIEEAAKTFFNKSAIDLNVLESSILASLPKWPTFYSPYNHPDRTLGHPYIYNEDDNENITKIITQKDLVINNGDIKLLVELISNLKWNWLESTDKTVICWVEPENFKATYNVDNEWCLVLKYSKLFEFLNNIQIKNWDSIVEYEAWRKDFILQRMLEDWYITFDQYKKAITDSFGYVFNQNRENIKAPHFVFYVKEYLEEKYWKEIISVWWLKIYTTLDWKLQEKAEEIVENQVEINKYKFKANNAALISIDNENWDILSMVWWIDYFDKENKWNVNIVTSKLQPGSTFKPFVYAIGLFNKEIWTKTPIYDLKTDFPSWYTPSNFDWKFMGKMTLASALNNSRNIPAIKMFFMAWWEANIISFMKRIGVDSLKNHGQYGAPLALWTWEMTPLELAKAYTVFANMWEKVEINPILKIVDSKWNTIEEKEEIKKEKVISTSQTYITNTMLSDTSSRPEFWNTYLSLNGRKVAAKTGTSTKQYERNWVKDIYPRNLWTIWYTPQITTVVWAWNTDWTELNYKWNGLEWAWPIWKNYMEFAHKWKKAQSWKKPSWVEEINISEITWLLPNPENYNSNLLVSSLFINKPSKYDQSYRNVKVDVLCNWLVSENTPDAAIKNATILQFHSLNPSNPEWENPVKQWSTSVEAKEKYWNIPNIITSINNNTCERNNEKSDIIIRSNIKSNNTYFIWENYIEIAYKSNNTIKALDILVNWTVLQTIETSNKKEGTYAWNIFIPWKYKNENVQLEIRAVDLEYYSESEVKNIIIWSKDTIAPTIKMENPIDSSIKLYETDYFNLKASVFDTSKLESVIIYVDWIEYKNTNSSRRIDIPMNPWRNMKPWKYIVQIEAIDRNGNKSVEDIKLEVLER